MGMGIKRGNDYNGVAQVNIGDKTTILAVEGGAIPVASISQPLAQHLSSVVAPAPASTSRIEGVTVGMAINKAVDICTKTGDVSEETLWHWSSTLIRLAQKLQVGNLAPETKPELQDEVPF